MTLPPLVPKGEPLRRAVAWLGEHGPWTPALIDEACRLFDVTPIDEEFLLREYRRLQDIAQGRGQGGAPPCKIG